MLALQEIGGLYLDCDTITLQNMDHLASHEFVMGVQQTIPGAMGGFCNAIMMGRRGSRFGALWLASYRSFKSSGRDAHWDFHSVKLPVYLYSTAPSLVHVLPHDKWFFPLWNHIGKVLFSDGDQSANRQLFDGQLAIHLWHNMISDVLDEWTPSDIGDRRYIYSQLARDALSALPEVDKEWLTGMFDLSFDDAIVVSEGESARSISSTKVA